MKKTYGLLFSLAAVVTMFSCNTNDNNTYQPAAYLMVSNLSPNAPALDLFINTSASITNLAYTGNTGYLTAQPATYEMRFAPTNTVNYLTDTTVVLAPATYYSAFAIDSLNKLKFIITKDELRKPSADSVLIRFFSFFAECACSGCIYNRQRFYLLTAALMTSARIQTFKKFIEIPAGSYTFNLNLTGTNTNLISASNVSLQGGRVYTLYAKGFCRRQRPTKLKH